MNTPLCYICGSPAFQTLQDGLAVGKPVCDDCLQTYLSSELKAGESCLKGNRSTPLLREDGTPLRPSPYTLSCPFCGLIIQTGLQTDQLVSELTEEELRDLEQKIFAFNTHSCEDEKKKRHPLYKPLHYAICLYCGIKIPCPKGDSCPTPDGHSTVCSSLDCQAQDIVALSRPIPKGGN